MKSINSMKTRRLAPYHVVPFSLHMLLNNTKRGPTMEDASCARSVHQIARIFRACALVLGPSLALMLIMRGYAFVNHLDWFSYLVFGSHVLVMLLEVLARTYMRLMWTRPAHMATGDDLPTPMRFPDVLTNFQPIALWKSEAWMALFLLCVFSWTAVAGWVVVLHDLMAFMLRDDELQWPSAIIFIVILCGSLLNQMASSVSMDDVRHHEMIKGDAELSGQERRTADLISLRITVACCVMQPLSWAFLVYVRIDRQIDLI